MVVVVVRREGKFTERRLDPRKKNRSTKNNFSFLSSFAPSPPLTVLFSSFFSLFNNLQMQSSSHSIHPSIHSLKGKRIRGKNKCGWIEMKGNERGKNEKEENANRNSMYSEPEKERERQVGNKTHLLLSRNILSSSPPSPFPSFFFHSSLH